LKVFRSNLIIPASLENKNGPFNIARHLGRAVSEARAL
jgi:hypothetical protein